MADFNNAVIRLLNDALAAADQATERFPQPNYVLLKVAEEAGEVVQAGVHCAEGRESYENLRKEIVQLIAMAIRLYVEGDQVNGVKSVFEEYDRG